ncbi:DUF1269 domain-containing protein [Tropicimonas marinistellae]|uniref:DUF1269 domain-containing protein n=1 Tax=Tropicimonas marinistellae TaxID=1739787 RepID=UPI0008309455|nr:DUF1269 domain-containing protein [Tropicimonas marinistellae]
MNFVAILMRDVEAAREARREIAGMTRKALVQLEDAVVAYTEDGEVKLDQTVNLTTAGALGGMWVGIVVAGTLGFMSGNPGLGLVGAAAGATGGALTGPFIDEGISDDMMKRTSESLEEGKAILFLLGGTDNPELVLEKLSSFEGEVIRSDLPDTLVQQINEALKQL